MKQLVGAWERQTDAPCSRVYPEFIEFREEGLFSGTGGEPGGVPGWDTGTWEIAGPRQIKISTMNDAVLTYEFSLVEGILTFVDADKCEVRYRAARR